MDHASGSVLEVHDLHKSYGPTHALNGLSFCAPRNSFFGLFGRNGSGKTTCFDCVTGLLGRDRGRVVMLGEEVGMEPSPELKQRFAYVGGHIGLYQWLTLEEHLEFVAGFYPSWDDARCRELREVFRLPMQQQAFGLSPGLHLQFQLLMALSRHPELIIIDEPGNIDPVVRLRLMQTITEILRGEEATVLMASHLLDELDGVCDQMCIIDAGSALMSGPVGELTAGTQSVLFRGVKAPHLPAGPGVCFGPRKGDQVEAILIGYTPARAEALARDLQAESYEASPVSLQDFFIATTEGRGADQ